MNELKVTSVLVTRCLPFCIVNVLIQRTGLIFKGQGTIFFVISALEDEITILSHDTGHQ
jgi:hypothetical protein